ncbi:site-specific integrase [Orlajensenia leifsoniae]|uniref:Site-specific integrase n=1 Tax=Orlajensenia leifsoniae TaxID=2561933 RepID=A0A4Y9QT42_9MICO|nr:site-specific integrase [Leifsonia flava]TFV94852.1 site-specific integrase [Leifsonia flava]
MIIAVERYKPRTPTPSWESVKPFVRDAAARSASERYSVQRLMVVVAPFVLWCVNHKGLPLQGDVLFTRRVIDQYLETVQNTGSRATYRSVLTAVSETLNAASFPSRQVPISRRDIQMPYSERQIEGFRAWANGQHTELKRRKARLMVGFGAGAGLRPNEFELMRNDVTVDTQGVVIVIRGGQHPRTVPLLPAWEDWIIPVLDEVPADAPLWMSPSQKPNRSMLNTFTASTIGKAPNGAQLRATWLVTHLSRGTRMKELMKAAGITQFANLDKYLKFVDDVEPAAYNEIIRGRYDR